MRATILPIKPRLCTSCAVRPRQASRHRTTARSFHLKTALVHLATIALRFTIFSIHLSSACDIFLCDIRNTILRIIRRIDNGGELGAVHVGEVIELGVLARWDRIR
jgi:hypothetical protein